MLLHFLFICAQLHKYYSQRNKLLVKVYIVQLRIIALSITVEIGLVVGLRILP
jgi:hypothetical protein